MVVNEDMVDRQYLLVQDTGSRQTEEVFEIHPYQSCGKTSYRRRCAWAEYIDWVRVWGKPAAEVLGFFGSVELPHFGWFAGSPRVSGVVMLKMIRHVARGLQDVSLASCLL